MLNFNCQISCPLKGWCHEIFDFRYFNESVSSILNPITLGPLNIFQKFAEVFGSSRTTIGVIDTCGTPWLANISANVRKIRKDPNAIFRGLGEGKFMKKTWSIKFVDCPFNYKRKELFKYKTGRRKHNTFNVMQRKTENGWRSVLLQAGRRALQKKHFRRNRKQNTLIKYKIIKRPTPLKLSRITSWQIV